jgi:membrane protein
VSLADGFKRRLAAARERSRLLDHLIATFEHYGKVEGNVLAGAVTFFGFLSFFPILAIAFSVVGVATGADPDAEQAVTDALHSVFPSMIGTKDEQIDPTQFKDVAATAGVIGLLTLLYTGLGWLSSLRRALQDVFELPRSKAHNFFVGKLVDVFMLGVIGLVLLVSVAVSSTVTSLVDDILEALSLADVAGLSTILTTAGIGLGFLSSTVMFVVAFRVLARPVVSARALWSGAVLAAVGFEALKLAAALLIAAMKDNPAFAVFGTALILLVWINYFSRLLLFGASWAATADRAAAHESAPTVVSYASARGAVDEEAAARVADDRAAAERAEAEMALVRSAAVVLGVTWLLRRLMRRED